MAKIRHHQTLGDYMAIAIGPILIMAMVGSLVYFLLEVLYAGKYEFRLQWILFCFVFGIVLVARMSMRDDLSAPWGLYGLILGFVVWFAICRYVQFDPDTLIGQFSWAVNAGLMGIVWWAAHMLTWDCTYIDDEVDARGVGWRQAGGMEDGEKKSEDGGSRIEDQKPSRRAGRVNAPVKEPPGSSLTPLAKSQPSETTWWERWRNYRAEQR